MSVLQKTKCNRCGKTSDSAAAWPNLTIQGGFWSKDITSDVHVCTECVSELADFMKHLDRKELERFAMHDFDFKMKSKERVLPDSSVEMTVSADEPFLVGRIEIARAKEWVVDDILVGNRSQLDRKTKRIPGDQLSGSSPVTAVHFEVCYANMEFRIRATYVGQNPEGMAFDATVFGVGYGFEPKKSPAA